jgi:hypothetical protein
LATDVLRAYQASASSAALVYNLETVPYRQGHGAIRFTQVKVWGGSEGIPPVTGGDLNIRVSIAGESGRPRPARIGIGLANAQGARLITCATEMTLAEAPLVGRTAEFVCHIPDLPLAGGRYVLTLFVERDHVIEDWLLDACAIDIEDADFFGCGKNAPIGQHGQSVLVRHSWREIKSSSQTIFEKVQGTVSAAHRG